VNIYQYFNSKKLNSNLILVAIFIMSCNLVAGFPLMKSKINKANEALDVYDYFKAKKLFYSAIEKSKVEANYGLAVIYSRTDNPFSNIDSAIVHIQNSRSALLKIACKYKKNASSLNSEGGGFEKDIINKKECLLKSVFVLKSESLFYKIDSILYTKAVQVNTVESFKKYQSYYKNNLAFKGPFYNESKIQIGSLIFNEALQKNKSEAILELSEKCDSSFCNFAYSIKTKIPSLLIELQFDEMALKKNIKEYNNFRNSHPKSLYELAIDDSIFVLSTLENTEKSYYDFIKANPQNRNVNKAWQLIYNSASNDNSLGFFKKFLDRYPEYPYIENVAKEFKLSQTVFYKIRKNKLYGFCDANGNELIKPSYEYVSDFSEGFCVASLNGKSGFIGRNGDIVIPFIYDEAESFQNGLAIVKKENKYHVINKKNDILYTSESEINDFSEKLCVVKKGEKYGYLDDKCNLKINFEFDNAYDFKNGFAVAEKSGKVGLINYDGKTIVDFDYEWIDNFYGKIYKIQTEESVKLINVDNGSIILDNCDFIDLISDGLAAFNRDEKVGYIDSLGTILITPQFEMNEETKLQQQFVNGYALVMHKGKNTLIDKTGKKVLPYNYQSIRKPSSGIIAVKKKNKWGYVDLNNDVKIKFQYQEASGFVDGLAMVKLKNKAILIDTIGNIKLKIHNQKIEFLGHEYLVIDNATHKNFTDLKFNTIVSDIDEIKPFMNNLWQIDKAGKMAYFDYVHKVFIWKEEGFVLN